MYPGRLKHQVVIEQPNVARTATGAESITWDTYVTRWASAEPLNGKEYFASKQDVNEVTIRFRIRYDSALDSVKPSWRISFDSRFFDIQSIINPREGNRELIFMCKEFV